MWVEGIQSFDSQSRENQKILLTESRIQLTGITAMDGRFEIVRNLRELGSPTWLVWDYDKSQTVYFFGPVWGRTKKEMAEKLPRLAKRILEHETERDADEFLGKPRPKFVRSDV